jgi:predicted Zn-dependent peptidase
VQATAREGVELQHLEAGALGEIEAVAAGRFDASDLARAKEQFLARHALESESVTDLAHQLGFFETIGGHAIWLDLPRRVAAVTADAAARYARERLDERHRTVGWLRP